MSIKGVACAAPFAVWIKCLAPTKAERKSQEKLHKITAEFLLNLEKDRVRTKGI